nr:TPA_asm: hypothetical protein [Pimephales minnow adintovirus]
MFNSQPLSRTSIYSTVTMVRKRSIFKCNVLCFYGNLMLFIYFRRHSPRSPADRSHSRQRRRVCPRHKRR